MKRLFRKPTEKYPDDYTWLLERTTDIIRQEIAEAEIFYRKNPFETPQKTLKLIKDYTDELAKEQEGYNKIELYLPFHIGLYLLVRYFQPVICFETGVERGGSTFSILKGLFENQFGTLYSFDISNVTRFMWTDEQWQDEEKFNHMDNAERLWVPIGTLVPQWLKNRWQFRAGDSLKTVPNELKTIPTIDFFCAGHSHTYKVQKAEVDNIWDRLDEGGIVVIDRSDHEHDRCALELIKKYNIPSDHYVFCKEAKYNLKFNYVIIIKPRSGNNG